MLPRGDNGRVLHSPDGPDDDGPGPLRPQRQRAAPAPPDDDGQVLHGHHDNDGLVPYRPDDKGPLPHCPGDDAGKAAGEGEEEGRGWQKDGKEEGSIGWRTTGRRTMAVVVGIE